MTHVAPRTSTSTCGWRRVASSSIPRATHDLWAASGVRALDHAVEIYLSKTPTVSMTPTVSKRPTPVTDAASLHAVRLLFEHLPHTLEEPGDDEARLRCLEAGWLSSSGR